MIFAFSHISQNWDVRMEDKKPFMPQNQYFDLLWSGDARSHGIGSRGTDLVAPPVSAAEGDTLRPALYHHDNKRKPPCIGGMELVSLSCNRVFISAESVGRGWCKFAIATKWYQFHTTDKCGFLFMPWITDKYTFVGYTKLVNNICTAVAKVITFSIITT